jgi:hypothetical protein
VDAKCKHGLCSLAMDFGRSVAEGTVLGRQMVGKRAIICHHIAPRASISGQHVSDDYGFQLKWTTKSRSQKAIPGAGRAV